MCYEDSDGYEPTYKDEDDHNLSEERLSLSLLDESSSDISSFGKGDVNIPPPPICNPINTKKSAQPNTNKLANNEPKLTAAFKGFYMKDFVGIKFHLYIR